MNETPGARMRVTDPIEFLYRYLEVLLIVICVADSVKQMSQRYLELQDVVILLQ